MSSGDDDDLDRILKEQVSNELVPITESPQLATQLLENLLGVIPGPSYHPLRQDRGTAGKRPLPGASSASR